MAMFAGLLTSPLAWAVFALLGVGLVAVFASGALKHERHEARFGLAALCAMKWQDFAQLIGTFLGERGLRRSATERKLGDGGFDLLLERGNSSYLVICKNAHNQSIGPQTIVELQRSMQHNEAEGAVVTTCGPADDATRELARTRGIEVIAGAALWRQVCHLLPYDVRDDAHAAARRERTRRLLLSLAAGLFAAAAAWVLATQLTAGTSDAPAAAVPKSSARPAAAPVTPTAAPAPHATRLPDPTLTDAQLETRRATAAMEVRSIPSVVDAEWSTKSTLVISLPAATGDISDTFVADICRVLLQYEEQRFSRLQLEVPSEVEDQPSHVRWRQCR